MASNDEYGGVDLELLSDSETKQQRLRESKDEMVKGKESAKDGHRAMPYVDAIITVDVMKYYAQFRSKMAWKAYILPYDRDNQRFWLSGTRDAIDASTRRIPGESNTGVGNRRIHTRYSPMSLLQSLPCSINRSPDSPFNPRADHRLTRIQVVPKTHTDVALYMCCDSEARLASDVVLGEVDVSLR